MSRRISDLSLLQPLRVIVILNLALLASCSQAPPPTSLVPAGHQPGEEAAVLAAMDRYMAGITAKDFQAMKTMQTPEGMTYTARPAAGGGIEIQARANAEWVDPANHGTATYRERYWSPTVLIRSGIATVWAPYEFWLDGETSHCGVDIFGFVKIDGAWKVANAMWTVEPDACTELRPQDVSQLRPQD